MNGETNAPSGATINGGKWTPPTPWKKLSTDEKFERMREQIKHLQSQVYRTENYTRRLRQIISTHQHLEKTGEVVEKISQYENGPGLVGESTLTTQNPEEAYF